MNELQDLLTQLACDLNGLVVPGQLLAAFLANGRCLLGEHVACALGALQDQLADGHRRLAHRFRMNILWDSHRKLANAAIHFLAIFIYNMRVFIDW